MRSAKVSLRFRRRAKVDFGRSMYKPMYSYVVRDDLVMTNPVKQSHRLPWRVVWPVSLCKSVRDALTIVRPSYYGFK